MGYTILAFFIKLKVKSLDKVHEVNQIVFYSLKRQRNIL